MSHLATAYYFNNGGFGTGDQPGGTVSRRIKVRFVDLLRPDHGYGFCNTHAAIAFELFRWMVRTSKGYPHAWDVLSARSTRNLGEVDGFVAGQTIKEDLRKRFLFAMLEPRYGIAKWRDDNGVDLIHPKLIPISYRRPVWTGDISSADVWKAVSDILGTRGQLAASHNACHKKARWIQKVVLQPYPCGWTVWLGYGYKRDPWGSYWNLNVCDQGKGELFTDFILSAQKKLNALMVQEETPR